MLNLAAFEVSLQSLKGRGCADSSWPHTAYGSDGANNVNSCAVFLARLRSQTLMQLNCCLMKRNGHSTLTRVLASQRLR